MNRTPATSARLVPSLRFHRWFFPAMLCALGICYTIWENIFQDSHSVISLEFLAGAVLLGVLGPLAAYGVLTWALLGAKSWEQAERASARQRQHLFALNQISESVNQSLELEDVLDHAIDRVLDVLHLPSGEVRLLDDHHLELHTARGVSAHFIQAEQSIPLGACACGGCALRGELMVIENMRLPLFANTTCACEGFSSSASVPVRTAERVIGVIHLASQSPRVFDAEDRALLTAIGYLVGTAVEKAQLHTQLGLMNQALEARVSNRTRELEKAKEELAEKAQVLSQVLTEERRVEEKTRAHIAHDLHDGVQQLIVGALYELQAAREAADRAPQSASSHIAAAQELLRQMESEMRHTIYDLRPLALDVQGLGPAIRECVARFERLTNVKSDLKIEGSPRRLSPEVEIAAFRIVQEALNNVQSHAQARQARVRVQFDPRDLAIEVSDDGIGFDFDAMKYQTPVHLGLIGMRKRAESVGGRLEIESRERNGTRIQLSVPVKSNRE